MISWLKLKSESKGFQSSSKRKPVNPLSLNDLGAPRARKWLAFNTLRLARFLNTSIRDLARGLLTGKNKNE
jgi:hypothetical protein